MNEVICKADPAVLARLAEIEDDTGFIVVVVVICCIISLLF